MKTRSEKPGHHGADDRLGGEQWWHDRLSKWLGWPGSHQKSPSIHRTFPTDPSLDLPSSPLWVSHWFTIFWMYDSTSELHRNLGPGHRVTDWVVFSTVELPSGKHTKNYGKSPFLMGKSTISMAIFNSYVSLPEGNDLTSWSQGLYCENLWFTSGTWPRKLADGKHDANFQKPDRPYLVKSLNLSI